MLKDKSSTSPFPATIYFPALPILTQVFHETTERLNLTLTIFLVPMAVCEIFYIRIRLHLILDTVPMILGSAIRQMGSPTLYHRKLGHLDFDLCRSCTRTNQCILVINGSSIPSVCRMYWHCCSRFELLSPCDIIDDPSGCGCVGAGAIADITTRANRGGYFGAFNVGPMVGPCCWSCSRRSPCSISWLAVSEYIQTLFLH